MAHIVFTVIALSWTVLGIVCVVFLDRPQNLICALVCYNLSATYMILSKMCGDKYA